MHAENTMMQLNLIFQDRSITIHLFENNTVKKWFHHFKKIASQPNIYECKKFTVRNECIDSACHWQNIKSAVSLLENLGYQFPIDLPEKFDENQQTLNYLHRFFTYNMLWYFDNLTNPCSNPYDPTFKFDPAISHQQWHDILDKINQAVHELEWGTVTQDNLKFVIDHLPMNYLNFVITGSNTNKSLWLDFDDADQIHNYKYFEYFDQIGQDDVLVMLNKCILGKCVLQSFFEHDDLNTRDCTGRLGSSGGFIFDLNQNRNKIYKSEIFKEWVHGQQCRVDLLPLEFSIGYLKNISLHKDYLINNWYKLQKIEFVEL